MSSINLDGAEITVIKTLGFGGAPMVGRDLKSRLNSINSNELFNILSTLISVGYVCSGRDLDSAEDLDKASFFVNPGYARDIKEFIDPEPQPTNKRVRRQ